MVYDICFHGQDLTTLFGRCFSSRGEEHRRRHSVFVRAVEGTSYML